MTTNREIVRIIADSEWGIKVRDQIDTQPDTGIILKETLHESWKLFTQLDNGEDLSGTKPVSLFHDACPGLHDSQNETNCTQICTTPETLFASWKTLWQCLSLATLTIGNATFPDSLKQPRNEIGGQSPGVQINDALWEFGILGASDFDGKQVLDLTYQCAAASCYEMSMGECSIGQLDAGFFQSDKLEWDKMSKALASLCDGLESDINIDIAGPGVLITYITQTAMVVFAWLFFLILAANNLVKKSTQMFNRVFSKTKPGHDSLLDRRESNLELLGRTNLAYATSTFLAELHEAQCFFVVAIEIALINASSRPAIFTGAENWQSLLWNRDGIRFLAGMGVWPIILGQITLRRAQLDSIYYLLLSTLAVVLAGVAADTASKPDPDNIYKMFETLNNLYECGGHPSLRTFCVEQRESIYWFVFPSESIYAFLSLLGILWWTKLWDVIVCSSWFDQKHKSLSSQQDEKWEWVKHFFRKCSLVVLYAAEAGAFGCVCFGLGVIRTPLLNLLLRGETGTWSVGQLVAVLIWAPVISKYAHLAFLGVEKGFRLRLSRAFDILPHHNLVAIRDSLDSNAEAKPSTTNEQSDETKPTLTEKDLEFDFDHSRIRDPRRTPGRVKRPRHVKNDLSEEWLSRFHIPNHKSEHTDPLYTFYNLHKCRKKGPNGSPTYDNVGCQLNYEKVAEWMKPIDIKQIKKWGEKRFQKVKADEWWSEPNQVEKDRFMKMHGGSKLRKDL
ncbi:hypothetical protein FLONG3_4682 [Fusarium longipes]|uniref:Uncharacterized protein n=1 Tax=Fusarium longipes TaxID=694270 RepID=A0A395SY61_9HYPO|nr:hypothetical protein FLONG3_4682 [Fusarium longipes]